MNSNPLSYKKNKVKNILYIGWLGNGNVGDDLLFELFKKMFLSYHRSESGDTVVNIDTFPSVPNYRADISQYDLIVLGGGSLIHSSFWMKVCSEGMEYGIPVVSWGTGVDGHFKWEEVESIHLPDEEADWFKEVYENFDYLSVRGPFTKNMLINTGLDKEVEVIGDPALAYTFETFGDEIEKDDNSSTVLINWGTSNNNVFGKDEIAVEEEIATAIHWLISEGYEVLCYPIWTEDVTAVKSLVERVNDSHCQAITEVYEARLLQKLISECRFSINMKLHASILSASANRPFISLAYRGKCFDFAESVNCLEYTLPTDQVTSDMIINKAKDVKENYDNIVERLNSAKQKYYPKIVASIQNISTVLNKRDEGEYSYPGKLD